MEMDGTSLSTRRIRGVIESRAGWDPHTERMAIEPSHSAVQMRSLTSVRQRTCACRRYTALHPLSVELWHSRWDGMGWDSTTVATDLSIGSVSFRSTAPWRLPWIAAG